MAKVYIIVEDGLVQDVYTEQGVDLDVMVIDLDNCEFDEEDCPLSRSGKRSDVLEKMAAEGTIKKVY